ncbi:MAG: hypothetical protein ABI903_09590 [Actinomycetota bacterium]
MADTLAGFGRLPAAPVADLLPVAFAKLALLATLVLPALAADFVAVPLLASDPVADLAVPLAALALAAVIFVALAFFVVFLTAASVGAAFFGGADFLAAEVAFLTAMLDPFKMALRRPQKTQVSVRIGPSGPVLNGETPPRDQIVPWTSRNWSRGAGRSQ